MKLSDEHKKLLPVYIASTLLLFTLIFLMPINPKFAGIAFLIYIPTVMYTAGKIFFRGKTPKTVIEEVDRLSDEAYKEGKFFQGTLRGVLVPACFAGLLVAFGIVSLYFR